MKSWIGIALAISVLINLYSIYRAIDAGVTATYMSEEIRHKKNQSRDVERLLPLIAPNLTKAELLAAARQAGIEVIEKRDDGTYVGGLQFYFSGNKVVAVSLN